MPTRTGQNRAGAENNFQVERAAQGDGKGSVSPTACTIDRALASGDRGRQREKKASRRGKARDTNQAHMLFDESFFPFPVFSSLLHFISWLNYFLHFSSIFYVFYVE